MTLRADSFPATPPDLKALIVGFDFVSRTGLKIVLEDSGCQVLGFAGTDHDEVASAAREHHPDVAVISGACFTDSLHVRKLSLPRIARAVKSVNPAATLVVLCPPASPGDVLEAAVAGVSLYMSVDDVEPGNFVALIRQARSAWIAIFDPRLLRAAAEKSGTTAPGGNTARELLAPYHLTRRELQVVVLMARGSSNRDISRELEIQPETAKRHVRNVIRKMRVSSRTHACVKAAEAGVGRLDVSGPDAMWQSGEPDFGPTAHAA